MNYKIENINDLITEFLDKCYPIMRIRVSNEVNYTGLKTRANFKRTIVINENLIFKISDSTEKYRATISLTNIVSRVFDLTTDESIVFVKKHLHVK